MKKDYVNLYQAWLEAYTAWLNLDSNYKQLYPMPRKPYIIKEGVYEE